MFLGVIIGLIFSSFSGGSIYITNFVKPFGTIFINSLKLIAIPLILASLIIGISDFNFGDSVKYVYGSNYYPTGNKCFIIFLH